MIIKNLNPKFSELKYKFWYSSKNIQNENVHFYNQLIIFWIELLIFGFKNINLEFQYQFLDQISLFEFKWKYHIEIKNLKFKYVLNNWNSNF